MPLRERGLHHPHRRHARSRIGRAAAAALPTYQPPREHLPSFVEGWRRGDVGQLGDPAPAERRLHTGGAALHATNDAGGVPGVLDLPALVSISRRDFVWREAVRLAHAMSHAAIKLAQSNGLWSRCAGGWGIFFAIAC